MSCDRYSYQVMNFGVYFSEYKYFSSLEAGKCVSNFQLQVPKKNVTSNSASEGFISIYFVLSDIYLVYYVVAII